MPDSSFTSSPFLPASAEELLQSGQFNTNVEVILGTCKDEGLGNFIGAWTEPNFFEDLRNNWDSVGVARLLGLTKMSDVTPEDVEKARKLLQFYVGGVENVTMANVQSLVDMMTDSEFLFGVHKKIGYLVDQGITVYHYILTHRGQFSITQLDGVPETVGNDLLFILTCLHSFLASMVSPMQTTSSMNGSQSLVPTGIQSRTNSLEM